MDMQKDDRKACGKEQTGDRDWKVSSAGAFTAEGPPGDGSRWERRFPGEGDHVPAVATSAERELVADIFAEIDPERVKAFLEAISGIWRRTGWLEAGGGSGRKVLWKRASSRRSY